MPFIPDLPRGLHQYEYYRPKQRVMNCKLCKNALIQRTSSCNQSNRKPKRHRKYWLIVTITPFLEQIDNFFSLHNTFVKNPELWNPTLLRTDISRMEGQGLTDQQHGQWKWGEANYSNLNLVRYIIWPIAKIQASKWLQRLKNHKSSAFLQQI